MPRHPQPSIERVAPREERQNGTPSLAELGPQLGQALMSRVDLQAAFDDCEGSSPIAGQKMSTSQEEIGLGLIELEIDGPSAKTQPLLFLLLILRYSIAEIGVEESRKTALSFLRSGCQTQPVQTFLPIALSAVLDTLPCGFHRLGFLDFHHALYRSLRSQPISIIA